MGAIHVGTSGWSYKHWKNAFYPEKSASAILPAFRNDEGADGSGFALEVRQRIRREI